jgi:hypothetical protein
MKWINSDHFQDLQFSLLRLNKKKNLKFSTYSSMRSRL